MPLKTDNSENKVPEGLSRLVNLTSVIADDELDTIGSELKEQVETDINSRKEWLEKVERHIELTTQVMEEKTWPWPGASNIKYPLVSTAAVQFHARAFPALLGNTSPVKGKVIGKDSDGVKANRARRVETYMSYQILYEMDDWLEDMDRALFILPIIGAMYKKTYFSPRIGRPISELIHPRDFIINYDARDFENARKTHRIWKTPNELKSLQNRGVYREFDGDDIMAPPKTASEARDKTQGLTNSGRDDPYALQELYEVHCLLDLDNDDYREPYIVTIRADDGKVFRIVNGYKASDIERGANGVVEIKAKSYFTPYFFLPDPESKTHGLGFGTMIGPINEAVNTIVNQLTDAGTLSNMQGGFLSRGIRIKGGNLKFNPGEWKTINATGDDLRKGIFPMPVREPSNVLFQLLGLLIDSGKDLSSVQDLMVGRNPGQNQPFSTSQMVMEQGLQVFNGIYKRIYRAMSKEFRLLYAVNDDYIDLQHYMTVLDDQGMETQQAIQERGAAAVMKFLAKDFNAIDLDIIPTAEPDMVAEVQRAMKAEALMQKIAAGLPLNVQVVTRRMLEAEQHEGIEELLDVPPPQPDPEIAFRKQEIQLQGLGLELKAIEVQATAILKEAQAGVLIAEAEGKDVERVHQQYINDKKENREQFDSVTKRMKEITNARQTEQAGKQTSGGAE